MNMAQKYPDIAWVGIEKNINVAALAVRKYTKLEQKPDNMLYIQGDAEEIDTWFAQGEVDVIHLNFSDPWPKKACPQKAFIQSCLYCTICENPEGGWRNSDEDG